MRYLLTILKNIRLYSKMRRHDRWVQRIYRQCREFTMIPERSFLDNLKIAEMVRDLPGCIVECGVWRGGMSAGLSLYLGNHRSYYLFDSFEGLPAAKPIDGAGAVRWQREKSSPSYYDNCKASSDFARMAMEKSGTRNYHIIAGWFEQTLPDFTLTEPIALLRLDGDWYDSTLICLENLFDRMVDHGIIIIDDYYYWDGCSRAVHDFISKRSARERIRNIGNVCYLVKMADESEVLVASQGKARQ